MEGKIIAVWGSPHSGKTTFATKLATAIYSSFESTVITLYTDLQTPMIPVLFPFDKPEDLGSVGYPLSRTEVEQSDIINNLVTVKEMQNFGFLGYRTGENRYTYPKFGKAKAEDLLNALCNLADYVIVDCTSDLEGNILAQTAIEKADQIIRLSSPDLCSISFFLSQLSVYTDSRFRLEDHIQGLNTPDADVYMPIEEAKTQLGEISFTLPFSSAVKEQFQQGKLHVKTTDKRFEARMQEIAGKVVAYGMRMPNTTTPCLSETIRTAFRAMRRNVPPRLCRISKATSQAVLRNTAFILLENPSTFLYLKLRSICSRISA